MDFNEYQRQAKTTAIYPEATTGLLEAITYCSLGLAGEAGEVCNKVKKLMRDEDTISLRIKIMHEIGDVLWYTAMLAEEMGINLDDLAESNLKKLAERKEQDKVKGEGDDRQEQQSSTGEPRKLRIGPKPVGHNKTN